MTMKALAIYLPAFHRIPENDEWWGDGFTEWDNVRSGVPYFPGHTQPVEPLDGWYYDLANKADIERQIDLANDYLISGFIFYHYWFATDRKIFERPAEILRDQIDKKTEYCFCWANESWITTWHGRDPETLLEQTYGSKREWVEHIEYLSAFFNDSRYIRIDGRPVLFIYKPSEIPRYEEMIDCWNNYLIDKGDCPVYIVEYISSKNKALHSTKSDAVTEFEPLYTCYFDLGKLDLLKRFIAKITHHIDYQEYDVLWEKIISRKRTYDGKPIIRGCFVGWDNSPRKERRSMIVRGSTADKFKQNLSRLINNGRADASSEYVVINAWNEWSEGAYLEPDSLNRYAFLEAVRDVMCEANGDGE